MYGLNIYYLFTLFIDQIYFFINYDSILLLVLSLLLNATILTTLSSSEHKINCILLFFLFCFVNKFITSRFFVLKEHERERMNVL